MWAEFHFLRPWWLLALLPVAGMGLALFRRRGGNDRWRGLVAPHLLPHLLMGGEQRMRLPPGLVLSFAMVLAVLALSGPSFRRQPSPLAEEELAVAIVVDCGETMELEDVAPSRAERAGQKVLDLLAQRPGMRAALYAFAGSAHRVMPFTKDASILGSFATELRPGLMPVKGDVAARALRMASDELVELKRPGAIVLLTDGVAADQVAAAKPGAPVHVLGIGLTLDESSLRAASRSWGGSYRSVSADDRDVQDLLGAVSGRYAAVRVEDGGEQWEDAGYWLLWLLLVPAALWFRRGFVVRHD